MRAARAVLCLLFVFTGCAEPAEVLEDDPPAEPCGPANPELDVGLRLCDEAAHDGFVLVAPNAGTATHLIDRDGAVVNRWDSAWRPGMAAVLAEGGGLVRSGKGGNGLNPRLGSLPGAGGVVERFDWAGELEWSWTVSGPDHLAHHDLVVLPGGNVLLVVWDALDPAEAEALGRAPGSFGDDGLYVDGVQELDPTTGDIVWRWSALDHLVQDRDPTAADFGVPADRPERVDFNAQPGTRSDWLHINGLAWEPDTDRIALSVHGLSEVWVIDHGLSTEEAAGPAGDLLFRWGNPSIRGAAGDRQLFGQHDPTWLDPATLLLFDNGRGRPGGDASMLVEVVVEGAVPDADAAPLWSWAEDPPTDFFAERISGAQRLPTGHTLVTDGPAGRLFELDQDGAVVWDYVNPWVSDEELAADEPLVDGSNAVFKARWYAAGGLELEAVLNTEESR